MSLRTEWKFQFTARQITEAATLKEQHHAARLEWWQNEREVAVLAAEGSTVSIKRVEVSGGDRAELSIDASLAYRINECEGKINQHRRDLATYQRWRESFALMNPTTVYELDPDDIAFFNITALAPVEV